MFQENDVVMYEATGVCRVQKIGYPDFIKEQKRQYYFLKPLHSACDNIFVPVDNGAKMRKILTKEQAAKLVEEIPGMEATWIEDDSNRETVYKEAVQSFDCRELLKIIKCLYLKITERKNEGKKPLQMDERYMAIAEDYLFGELATALDIPIECVREHIAEKVQEKN